MVSQQGLWEGNREKQGDFVPMIFHRENEFSLGQDEGEITLGVSDELTYSKYYLVQDSETFSLQICFRI